MGFGAEDLTSIDRESWIILSNMIALWQFRTPPPMFITGVDIQVLKDTSLQNVILDEISFDLRSKGDAISKYTWKSNTTKIHLVLGLHSIRVIPIVLSSSNEKIPFCMERQLWEPTLWPSAESLSLPN